MKKYLFLAFIPFMCFGIGGCDKFNNSGKDPSQETGGNTEEVFKLGDTTLLFSFAGTSESEEIKVGKVKGLSEVNEDWLSLRLDGEILHMDIYKNEDTEERSAVIDLLYDDGAKSCMKISQVGYAEVEIDFTGQPFKDDAGRISLIVESVTLIGGASDMMMKIYTEQNVLSNEGNIPYDKYIGDVLAGGEDVYDYEDYLAAKEAGEDFVISSGIPADMFVMLFVVAVDEFGNPGKFIPITINA